MVTTTVPDVGGLIEQWVPYARKLAFAYAHRNQLHEVHWDDIMSDALLGLIHAASAYDPDRGTAFTTFATPRIRGAIVDGFRARTRMPRQDYRDATQEQRAHARLASSDALTEAAGTTWHPRDEDPAFATFEDRLTCEQIMPWIHAHLDARRAYVIIEVTYHGRTQAAVAADLGVTESRVCQMLQAARTTLQRSARREHLATV